MKICTACEAIEPNLEADLQIKQEAQLGHIFQNKQLFRNHLCVLFFICWQKGHDRGQMI